MPSFKNLSLEELWTQTLLEIDILHDRVDCNKQGLSATERNAVARSLIDLRTEGPLSEEADDHVGRIETHLTDAVDRETLGFRNVFDGYDDPELGSVGTVISVPVLSDNGRTVDELRQALRVIVRMRGLISARIDARRQIAQLQPE